MVWEDSRLEGLTWPWSAARWFEVWWSSRWWWGSVVRVQWAVLNVMWQIWVWLWLGPLSKRLPSIRERGVTAGGQWCGLSWSGGWSVEEGPLVYWHRVIFLFPAEAQVLTGGGKAWLCFMEIQTLIEDRRLQKRLCPMLLAMLLKEINRIPTEILHRKKA